MENSKEFCPYCGANLQGDPIPKELQKHYGNATHFSRKIGISSLEKDRVIKWQCPDCKQEWEREE
ncbi:hypothetical protein QWV57_08595 [Geobacillus zalihae]|uniref:Uncharacterized protein n=1 Tax=Geobacillus zalihae TaxID=213419 RepID=A0A7H1RXF7_9BACL|nr:MULTISPECIES: hypothetical protein [Bacillaceae]EPR27524.1 hypothetical protein I656_02828 [Geobacillus sp. WSUCF1]OQP19338.1 hypothetical protein B1694_14940 [Geobacillus zalihae]QNU18946.1 hypothetical protein IC807_04680 [Geobacillus zalihae]WKA48974.1 hypothetical protein QWV57_08595 [Geobacillus zalihae]WMT18446.1 hypothetical protein RFB12_14315 [Parageobacillus toebii]